MTIDDLLIIPQFSQYQTKKEERMLRLMQDLHNHHYYHSITITRFVIEFLVPIVV